MQCLYDAAWERRRIKLRRNVGLAIMFRMAMDSLALSIPTIVVLWQSCGLTMLQITLTQCIFALVMGFLDGPTGYFADLFGRRMSLLFSSLIQILGLAVYCGAGSLEGFLLGELLFGIGMAFASGADQAFLYDSLAEMKETQEFPRLWAKLGSYTMLYMAACCLIGGRLAVIDLRLPLYAALGLRTISLALIAFMVEPNRDTRPVQGSPLGELLRIGGNCILGQPRVRWLILAPALINASNNLVLWLYQPYFQLVGIDMAYFGVIFAGFNVVAAAALYLTPKLNRRLSDLTAMLLPLVLVIVSYQTMAAFLQPISVVFCLVQQAVRGYSMVVFTARLNDAISSERRATISSFQSMATRLLYAGALLPLGWAVDTAGLAAALRGAGLLLAALGLAAFCLLFRRRHEHQNCG